MSGKGISSRVFCKVGGRTELLIVPDATQPVCPALPSHQCLCQPVAPEGASQLTVGTDAQVAKLVDMVNSRFGTQVAGLAIMDCQLRWDDIIRDVIRDGDVVEALASGVSASAYTNGDGSSSLGQERPPVATLTPRSTEDSASGLTQASPSWTPCPPAAGLTLDCRRFLLQATTVTAGPSARAYRVSRPCRRRGQPCPDLAHTGSVSGVPRPTDPVPRGQLWPTGSVGPGAQGQ